MTHELKRPVLFNVQQTKTPVIGIVSQLELARLDDRLEIRSATAVDGASRHPHHRQQQQQRWPSPSTSALAETPCSPRRAATATPSSVALPLVCSPRPEKPVYIPSPSKTPQYFRWKRPLPPSGYKTLIAPTKPAAPRPRLSASSLRPSPWRDTNCSSESAVRPTTLAAMSSSGQRLRQSTQHSDGDNDSDSDSDSDNPFPMPPAAAAAATEERVPTTLIVRRRASLFEYSDPHTSKPSTPTSAHLSTFVGSTTVNSHHNNNDIAARSHAPLDALSRQSLLANAFATPETNAYQRSDDDSASALESTAVDRDALLIGERSSPPAFTLELDAMSEIDSSAFDAALASSAPLVLQRTAALHAHSHALPSHRHSSSSSLQPQEKAIVHHVHRGALLRKYLHVSNITRKLKETEQQLAQQRLVALTASVASPRALVDAPPSRRTSMRDEPLLPQQQQSLPPSQLRKMSTKGSAIRLGVRGIGASDNDNNDDDNALSDKPLVAASAEQRRRSSIDRSINKTVKRIRRLSSVDTTQSSNDAVAPSPPSLLSPQQQQQSHVTTPAAARMKAKYASLRAISERHQPSDMRSAVGAAASVTDPVNNRDDSNDTETNGASNALPTGSDNGAAGRMEPSATHMLRICQHVIAKRAIKAFAHQETSVLHRLEVALRDDDDATQQQQQQRQHAATLSDSSSSSSQPIDTMPIDVVDTIAGYLTTSDQRLTLDELVVAAQAAETTRRWKRAILLASACLVMNRESATVVLLRARCCRRLGLWTQAIQDVGLAIAIRPLDARLCLWRAFLLAAMRDFPSALADVTHALLLQPTSTDALLLRADIFYRQHRIAASLQDLSSVLRLDPRCWRAYYDRATIRIRAIECSSGRSDSDHWDHMTYDALLVSVVEDYINALRKGCKMVEVIETIGDLTVRLMEFTNDTHVLRQVVQSLRHLVTVFAIPPTSTSDSSRRAAHLPEGSAASDAPLTTLERELLVAALHAQRGRLLVLFGSDRAAAKAEFDHAVVSEYHYPVAHFYRGAFAALVATSDTATKDDGSSATARHIQHLTRSIALDPTIAGAYTVRGALHLKSLQFTSALQDFKAAVATDPTLYEVWLQIALIYLNHYHDSDACIVACTNALTNDSCLARALYLRAEALTRQHNTAAALRDYGRLTLAAPDDRWTHLLRGRLLLQLDRARPALYSFILFMEGHGDAVGDSDTHSKDSSVLCGRAFKLLTRFQRAVLEFERAAALHPTSDNLVLLSESLQSMGDTANALRVSDKLLRADPGSYKGYVRRAQLFVSLRDLAAAMREYDKALFLAPREARVYYERGVVQMQQYLHWRSARPLLVDRTAASAPQQQLQRHNKRCKTSSFEPALSATDVELALGVDVLQSSDADAAAQHMAQCFAGSVADLTKCIRLEPARAADAFVDRAELYALGEDYDRAFRDFDAAIKRQPTNVRAHVNAGVLKCQFGSFAAAIADFDQAVKCDPKLALALFNRGVAYHRLGLYAQATVSYTACITLRGVGRDVDAHRNRALARCHLLDFVGALADLDEVQLSAPDDDDVHGALGYVLLQLGRYEDAAQSFAAFGSTRCDMLVDSGNAYYNLATNGRTDEPLDHATYNQHLTTARRFYIRAARIDPSSADVRLNLVNCLRKQRAFAQAITQCDAIAGLSSNHHAALECKAFVLFAMQRVRAAIDCMDAAIRACVASSTQLENSFLAFTSASLRRNALERRAMSSSRCQRTSLSTTSSTSFKDAASVDDTVAKTLSPSAASTSTAIASSSTNKSKQLLALYIVNRGILYEALGDGASARQNYSDAIDIDAQSAAAHICLGTRDLLDLHIDDSVALLSHALVLDPQNIAARINVGVAHLYRHEIEQALAHADTALAMAPTCSYAHANKAVALAQRGDTAQAELHYKLAIEALPSQSTYYVARGKLIAQQKRLQDALIDFSTALFLGYDRKL